MVILVLSTYFVVLGILALLGVHRLYLTFAAIRARRRPSSVSTLSTEDAPTVVVQLPLYNESFVAERLIRAVSQLRYPEGRWSIQVLDDSTDNTRRVVDQAAEAFGHRVRIDVVRRPDRTGYKAGALAYGLQHTNAELVAVFDADFVPAPDFLEQTVPALIAESNVGLVQARWGHLNRKASWLTRAQAIFLDGHFSVEHRARAHLGHFFNFNGTAGIWRRQAIDDAGGWRDATITEDLDLSYRAQMAGWRFTYLDDVIAPAELPESWAAFRSQQARWVRGSVETARLLIGNLMKSKLSVPIKLDGLVHLTQNFAYLFMALLAILLPLAVVLREELGWRVPGGRPFLSGLDWSMLSTGTVAMGVFYAAAAYWVHRRFALFELLFAMCLGAGMSLQNAHQVLRGLVSKSSEFVRTPKAGDQGLEQTLKTYRPPSRIKIALVELLFFVYFLATIGYAVHWAVWGALPFLLLYAIGFGTVSLSTLKEIVAPRLSGLPSSATRQQQV